MAVTAHAFPELTINGLEKLISLNGSDVVKVALYTGTITWNSGSQAYTTLASAVSGSSLTEVSSANYVAGGLTVTTAVSNSTIYTTLTSATAITWTNVTFAPATAIFYDSTVSNDLICYWDFGGAQSVTAANFTLTLATANAIANAIIQYTHN